MGQNTQTEGETYDRAASLFHQYVPYGGLEQQTVNIDAETLRVEHSDDALRALLHCTDAELSKQGECEKKAERALVSWTRGFGRRTLALVGLDRLMENDSSNLAHAKVYQQRLQDFRGKLAAAVALSPLTPKERSEYWEKKSMEEHRKGRQDEEGERILGLAEDTKVPPDVAQVLVPLLDRFNREINNRATLIAMGRLPLDEISKVTPGESALLEALVTLRREERPIELLERWAEQLARRMSKYYGSETLEKEVRLAICRTNGVPYSDEQHPL